jgi:SAM-dependent methyltransferase
MPGRRNDDAKKQNVGGQSYSLRESSGMPWPGTVAKGLLTAFTAPLMVTVMFFTSVVMATPLRNTLLSLFLPRIMEKVDEEFHEERTTLLSTISGGSVLDVGSGGGAYFRYFAQADRVVAVEPFTGLYPKLQETAKEHGLVDPPKEFSILADLKDVTGTFDHIILGNVLCEVPSVDITLEQVDRLLQPGGKVYFSEHIGRPMGTWTRWLQDCFNPMHRHISVGCNCNRDSLEKICSKQNWEVVYWKYEHFQVFMGPFVLGLAVKKE